MGGRDRWVYAYRAIDEYGQVIDVYLSDTRDTAAATAFFEQARADRRAAPPCHDGQV